MVFFVDFKTLFKILLLYMDFVAKLLKSYFKLEFLY